MGANVNNDDIYRHSGQSDVLFSMNSEDVVPTRHALDIQPGERVFTIASSGMNAITLLLDDPVQVIALDTGHPQICLAKLQSACIKYLSYQETLDFLGVNRHSVLEEKRLEIYESILREHLEKSVRIFWDANKSSLAFGVLHCGRREGKLRTSAHDYFQIALDQRDIDTLLSMGDDMEEQAKFSSEIISTDHFRKAFECLVWKRILAKYDLTKTKNVDYASLWYERLCVIMETMPAKSNYFLEYILTGDISGKYSLPEYLQRENFTVLKQRIDRVQWVEEDLLSWFYNSSSLVSFNKVCFSNVPDWIPTEDFSKLICHISENVELGSRIAFFSAKGRGRYWPADVVERVIRIEHKKEKESVLYDRAPWWEPIRVATVVKAPQH